MKLMKSLHLKDKFLKLPIIQGGMGIGVSRCRLAGAVAKEGGMGVLSTAQIGYDDPDFAKHPEETNLKVLPEQIKKAKEIAGGNGMVAVNIMAVTQLYETYVKPPVLPVWTRSFPVQVFRQNFQNLPKVMMWHWLLSYPAPNLPMSF